LAALERDVVDGGEEPTDGHRVETGVELVEIDPPVDADLRVVDVGEQVAVRGAHHCR
jgi:hypothetical protein